MKQFVGLFIILQLLGLAMISCFNKSGSSESVHNDSSKVKNGLVTIHYPSEKVRFEINYENGKRHGIAKEYFENGNLFQEITYVHGVKNGIAKRYYEAGELAQETYYVDDVIDGITKRYRQNGKPISEAIYNKGNPCVGLKEYTVDGVLKKKYPSIVITPINTVLKDNRYRLKITLSNDAKNVDFFQGKLEEGKCLSEKMMPIYNRNEKKGEAILEYFLPPGSFLMDEINVIAKLRTVQGNYYITQQKYNVAIENK